MSIDIKKLYLSIFKPIYDRTLLKQGITEHLELVKDTSKPRGLTLSWMLSHWDWGWGKGSAPSTFLQHSSWYTVQGSKAVKRNEEGKESLLFQSLESLSCDHFEYVCYLVFNLDSQMTLSGSSVPVLPFHHLCSSEHFYFTLYPIFVYLVFSGLPSASLINLHIFSWI